MQIIFNIKKRTYVITSNARSYTLCQQIISPKGVVSQEQLGYYQNITSIAEKLLKLQVEDSTAKKLHGLLKEMEALKHTLQEIADKETV